MKDNKTCAALLDAFKEISECMHALLFVYDVHPELTYKIALGIRHVFRTHIIKQEPNLELLGDAALLGLVKEIEIAQDYIVPDAKNLNSDK